MLSDVPSHSSPKAKTARRSTRIASRTDENIMGAVPSNGRKRKQINPKGVVQSSTDDDDDEDNVIVRKKKTANKRRSNRIQSSHDEDDNFVADTPKAKSPKPKKRRSNKKIESKVEDVVVPKTKTPVKGRKPLLTIKCKQITDYFEKSTKATANSASELVLERII